MGFLVKAAKAVFKVVAKVVKVVGGVFGFLVGGKKAKKASNVNNLTKNLEPETARKICFGRIAVPLDVRFWEVYGTSGQYYAEVLAHATHRITAFRELYLEQDLAIDASGNIQSKYVGILTRNTRLGAPGQTALAVGSGSLWNSTSTFDGCAYSVLTWLPDEKKLPNGIPNRYTQICDCAPVYDPRRDSTQPGGSGTHRITDQSTWDFATIDANGVPIGRNNALQALWYLIGWRIQNPTTGEWVLVAGRGVDPNDINMTTFIAGANNCEAAGYYTDMVLSTDEAHTSNENKITCNGLIGRLIDPGGLWSYYANVNDTASIAVTLTDDDLLDVGSMQYNPVKGISDQFNQVVGKYVNPSNVTLYQAFPYPMVRDTTYEANLGVKKRATQDFEQVLDYQLAQRLARLKLNENQYQAELQATWGPRAIKAQAYSVVRYVSVRFGWTKLFRVWRHEISNGQCQLLLREIDPSIWSAGTVSSALVPSTGSAYDPTLQILASNVVVSLTPMVGANGDKADGFTISWGVPPVNVRRTEIRYRLVGTTNWFPAGPVGRDVLSATVGPLLSGAIYEAQVRHISMHEVPGLWVYPTVAPANASGQFQLGTTGTVNAAAIAAAGGTANWANVTGLGRPEDNADVTGSHYAGGVTGSSPWLFEPTLTPTSVTNSITAAQNAASAAQSTANSANQFATDVADNNKFSSDEKKRYVALVNGWVDSVPNLIAQGNALGQTGQAADLNTKWTDFYNYLNTTCNYSAVNTSTAITRTTFIAKSKAFADALVTLSNALDARAAQISQWNGVSDTGGRPQDYADVTGTHNAAGFAGQTEWATYTRPIATLANPNINYFPYPNGVNDGRTAQNIGWGNDAAFDNFTTIGMGYTDWIGGGYYQQWRNGNYAATTLFPYFDYLIDQSTVGNFCGVSLFGYCSQNGGAATFQPYVDFLDASKNFVNSGYLTKNDATGRWELAMQIPPGTFYIRIIPKGIFAATNGYQDVTWNRIKLEFNLPTSNVTPYNDAPTLRQQASRLDPRTGRVLDPRLYNTQNLLGPDNVSDLTPTYTVGGSNVTVNLPAHNRVIAGPNGPITLYYGATSFVWPFSTYWTAYYDDAAMGGNGAPGVGALGAGDVNSLLYPGRYQVASGITPASGGGGGSTGGGGGGGFVDPNCVEIYSYMPTGEFAYQIEPGDEIIALDESTYNGMVRRKVTANKITKQECVKIISQSGIELILSKCTPCTLKGGSTVLASEVFGKELAVMDGEGFRWEPIIRVDDVGIRDVAHISADNGTYAAGAEDGRYIFTHNWVQKP